MQVDNAEVIVTEWVAPGAETGRHRHGHDYVVVPAGPTARVLDPPRATATPLVAGQAYLRKAGVEHNVINASANEVVFVETGSGPHCPRGW